MQAQTFVAVYQPVRMQVCFQPALYTPAETQQRKPTRARCNCAQLVNNNAMRFIGRDSFILSRDVTARLIAEGVIDKPATSQSALKAVQGAFNIWMDQSGRALTEISQTLARSV